MKYDIQLPALCGEIVPLLYVATTKALARATAGHTPFHKPTYDGSLQGFANALLREARSGRLTVCDQNGSRSAADELIARAEAEGTWVQALRYIKEPDWERLHRENEPIVPGAKVWNLSHLDLGPTEIDWGLTHISALCTTLKWLNDWGATVGDEFALNHDGVEWADERGILVGRAAPCGERDALLTDGRSTGPTAASHGDVGTPETAELVPALAMLESQPAAAVVADPPQWKMRIQIEAADHMSRLRKSGASPTVRSILDRMVTWCVTNNVRTDGRILPSAGYLKTHVLGGKHWTPPTK